MTKALSRVRPRNLDGVVLPVGEEFLLRYHVAQGVVEGLQVGVELVAQVARQETEVLACLYCRAGQDDAADFLVLQSTDSESHSRIGFACAGRTDGENHVVLLHGLYQSPLVGGAGTDKKTVAPVHEDFLVGFRLGCGAAIFKYLHDDVLVQPSYFVVVGLHGLQFAVEMVDVLGAPHHFQHVSSGNDFQFWEKDSDEVENLVVVTPKACVVNLFEREYFFCDRFFHDAKIQKKTDMHILIEKKCVFLQIQSIKIKHYAKHLCNRN